jgi:hypothetical protein
VKLILGEGKLIKIRDLWIFQSFLRSFKGYDAPSELTFLFCRYPQLALGVIHVVALSELCTCLSMDFCN